jgi:hypothetical protein
VVHDLPTSARVMLNTPNGALRDPDGHLICIGMADGPPVV